MQNTRHKKFQFWEEMTGECNITPIGTPIDETNFKQPIECCFVANDPTGTIVDRMFEISGSPDHVADKMIGKLTRQLFDLKSFECYGVTVIEVDGTPTHGMTVHIHANGVVDAFDITDWNQNGALDKLLNDCQIKRS